MASLIENQHIYAMINDTFNAPPEEISYALKWRAAYLEKRRESNRKYAEKLKEHPEKAEEAKRKSKEWFQNNKARAAARQKARYECDPEYRSRILEYKKLYYKKQQDKKKSDEQIKSVCN
jgi:hypothetical protein